MNNVSIAQEAYGVIIFGSVLLKASSFARETDSLLVKKLCVAHSKHGNSLLFFSLPRDHGISTIMPFGASIMRNYWIM